MADNKLGGFMQISSEPMKIESIETEELKVIKQILAQNQIILEFITKPYSGGLQLFDNIFVEKFKKVMER